MTVREDDPHDVDDDDPLEIDDFDADAGFGDAGLDDTDLDDAGLEGPESEDDWGLEGADASGAADAGFADAGEFDLGDGETDWGVTDGSADFGVDAADWGEADTSVDASEPEPQGPNCDQAPAESRTVSVDGGDARFDVTNDGYQMVRGPGQLGGEEHARFEDSRDEQGNDLNDCPGNLSSGWQDAVESHQSSADKSGIGATGDTGAENLCDGEIPVSGEKGYGSAEGMSHDHEQEQGLSDPCGGEAYYDVPDQAEADFSEEVMSQDLPETGGGLDGGLCDGGDDDFSGTDDICLDDEPMSY
ncbi:hypothetical protein [Aestuariispira insulae]|uniref:Uncharacterized protein n=1 Tax=Aestuariispira insulae TaxID=1461337 RepID=A0A3D9HLH5_9PROT|nr:hypothetical protein [Aestuariispira insulae]RED49746.1 hypothetical protein DFP90_105117 [Aestuariispira insulae]